MCEARVVGRSAAGAAVGVAEGEARVDTLITAYTPACKLELPTVREALKKLLDCWLPGIRAVLLVCACCLFSVASYGQAPAPTESRKKVKPQAAQSQEAASKDQRGTEKSPLILKVIPTTKSEDEAALERQDREDRTTNERLLIFANILLAVFTGLLAIYTAKLWREAKRTAERQLRAYVFVDSAEIINLTVGFTPVARLVVKIPVEPRPII
jgi:hypothetical protein